MDESIYEQLSTFYEKMGISAVNFKCKHYSLCSNKSPERFTTAKESFVSKGYVQHQLPRIIFISLDSGSAESDPKLKTLEAVRQWEEENQKPSQLPKNKHWYQTHEMAHFLLSYFNKDLVFDEARHFFAHVNSAKCCENNYQRKQANDLLFINCREFLPGELEILNPDIIITQGKWARIAIESSFQVLKSPAFIPEELSEVKVIWTNSSPVLWISTFHPRNPNFYTKNKSRFSQYGSISLQFMKEKFSQEWNFEHEEYHSKNIVKNASGLKKHKDTSFSRKSNLSLQLEQKSSGTIELLQYPEIPSSDFPKKIDCLGYTYISMVQLCNIAEQAGNGRNKACRAFGGDKGKIPVISERQAREWKRGGHLVKKFVLIDAVDRYFQEIGLEW